MFELVWGIVMSTAGMTWGIDLLVDVILEFRWLRPFTDISRSTAEHAKRDRESNLCMPDIWNHAHRVLTEVQTRFKI